MVSVADIAGSLGLDISPYLQGLDDATARTQVFMASTAGIAAGLTLPPLTVDTSAAQAGLDAVAAAEQQVQSDAQAMAQATATASGAADQLAAASGTAADAQALEAQAAAEANAQLQGQIDTLSALTAEQQQQISSLQQQVTALKEHGAASQQSGEFSKVLTERLSAMGIPIRELQGGFSQMKEGLSGIGEGMGAGAEGSAALEAGLAGLAVGGFAVAAFAAVEATKSFIEYADSVRETAEMTGASQGTIEAMQLGFQRIGQSADAGGTALRLFERNAGTMSDQLAIGSVPTGKFADALTKIGVDANAFNLASVDQQLQMVMTGFEENETSINKTQVAMSLFGRQGAAMIPMLSGQAGSLADLRAAVTGYGADVEGSQAKVLKWHKEMADLHTEILGLEIAIGSVLLPVVTGFISKLGEAVTVGEKAADVFGKITAPLGFVKDRFESLPGPAKAAIEIIAAGANPIGIAAIEAQALGIGLDKLSGSYAGASAAAKANADAEAQAAEAGIKVIDNMGLLGVGLSQEAQARTNLIALAKEENSSDGDRIAIQAQLAESTAAASLSVEEWNQRETHLQDLMKSNNPEIADAAKLRYDLDQAVARLGPDTAALALAEDAAAEALQRMGPAAREATSAIGTTFSALTSFQNDLVTSGAAASQEWGRAYGTTAQQIAADLHTAADDGVSAWHAAADQVVADTQAMYTAIASSASAEEQARLKDKLDTDKQIADAAKTTALDEIATEQAYVKAVEQSANEQRALHRTLFDDELRLSHQTAAERASDLGQWLQAEITTIQDIQALEVQYANSANAITRAVLAVRIAADRSWLADVQQTITDIDHTISADAKELKLDTKLNTAAITAATTDIRDQTIAVTDLNAAWKAGNEIVQQRETLQKQVHDTGHLYTQSEVDGLHAITEGYRATATAELDATSAAQQHWADVIASIDTTTGLSTKYSQAEVKQAQANYTTLKQISDQGVKDFTDALTTEGNADRALTTQQTAAANALNTLHADTRAGTQADIAATQSLAGEWSKFGTAVRVGSTELGSSFDVAGAHVVQANYLAAQSALATWRTANAAVLADDEMLKGELSAADRAYWDNKRKGDAQTAADAMADYHDLDATYTRTANDFITNTGKQEQALTKLNADTATTTNALTGMWNAVGLAQTQMAAGLGGASTAILGQLTAGAAQAVSTYQQDAAAVLDIEHQLTLSLSPEETARLNAALTTAQGKMNLSQQAANAAIADEQRYVSAVQQAEDELRTLRGQTFDATLKLEHLSVQARAAGEGEWLQAAIAIEADLANLERQLTVTVGDEAQKQLLILIKADKARLADVEETIREIEARISAAAQSATASAQSTASAASAAVVPALGQIRNAATQTAQAVQAVVDPLKELLGIYTAPTSEELGLQVQSDQLGILIARQQEAGDTSSAYVKSLEAQKSAIDAQISGFKNERTAMTDLADAQGKLDAGTSTSITALRGAAGQLQTLDQHAAAATRSLNGVTATGSAFASWSSGMVSSIGAVTSALGGLAVAAGGTSTSGGGFSPSGYAPGLSFQSSGGYRGSYVEGQGQPQGFGGKTSVPTYDLGGIVPEDQMAIVHKGEWIIPPDLIGNPRQGPALPASLGGGQPITVAISINGPTSPELAQQIRDGVRQGLQDAFGREATLNGIK